jgi:outer membrane lipoprotein LolB
VAQTAQAPQRLLTPDGWTLTYGEWQDDAANTVQNHPKRIDLSRDTKQAGPVSIRIVIDKWQPSDNTAGKS